MNDRVSNGLTSSRDYFSIPAASWIVSLITLLAVARMRRTCD
jgi:hypothetical protein